MGNHKILARALRETVNGTSPRTILELGAGDGQFLLRVANALAPSWPGVSVTFLDRQETVSDSTLTAFSTLGWRGGGTGGAGGRKPRLRMRSIGRRPRPLQWKSSSQIFFCIISRKPSWRDCLKPFPAGRDCSWRSSRGAEHGRCFALDGCGPSAATPSRATMQRSACAPGSPAENFPRSGRRARSGSCAKRRRGFLATRSLRTGEFRMSKPITIVGGGLAGLTLGIGLRQRGVPVTVWEAGRYPRHRVCGEFISGRGLGSLARLGLRAQIEKAGAVSANTAAFFSTANSTPPRKLPSPALCLSRRVLDDFLAAEFRALGGELRAGERWHGNAFGEGAVRATGRRAQAQENGAH